MRPLRTVLLIAAVTAAPLPAQPPPEPRRRGPNAPPPADAGGRPAPRVPAREAAVMPRARRAGVALALLLVVAPAAARDDRPSHVAVPRPPDSDPTRLFQERIQQ